MTFDREKALDELGIENSSWHTVKNWIRDMVMLEPKVMREVSKARFGDLGGWIQRGSGNVKVCGCLVGTTALKLVADRNHFVPDVEVEEFECVKPIGDYITEELFNAACQDGLYPQEGTSASAPDVIETLMGPNYARLSDSAYDAGVAAAVLGEDLGQQTAVALIKDEILRQLQFRQQRVRAGRKAAKLAKRNRRTGQFV